MVPFAFGPRPTTEKDVCLFKGPKRKAVHMHSFIYDTTHSKLTQFRTRTVAIGHPLFGTAAVG